MSERSFRYQVGRAIGCVVIGVGIHVISLAIESEADADARTDAALTDLGFKPVFERGCPAGVKGYFRAEPGTGAPVIAVCTNNHEATGDMSNTQAHEMAHAAQWCLMGRGLGLSDKFDIVGLVIKEWRDSEKEMNEIHEQEVRRLRLSQVECAAGSNRNKAYCDKLPGIIAERQKRPSYWEDPIMRRANAGEPISLADLVGSPDLQEIVELYPPEDRYHELEARAFSFLGRDAALKAIAIACKDPKTAKKK